MDMNQIGALFILLAFTCLVYNLATASRKKKGMGPPSVPYYLPFGLDNMWELNQV